MTSATSAAALTAPSASLEAVPRIAFRRTPAEARLVRTRDELRGALLDDLLSGRARWFAMEDLALVADGARGHARLLRVARPFRTGLAGLNGNPHTAVFDWSTVRGPVDSAILAGAVILEAAVTRNGAVVIHCEPRDAAVAAQLVESGLAERAATWVGEPRPDDVLPHVSVTHLSRASTAIAGQAGDGTLRQRVRQLQQSQRGQPRYQRTGAVMSGGALRRPTEPVIVADPRVRSEATRALNAFGQRVERVLALHDVPDDYRWRVDAVVNELVSNASGRSGGTRIALAAEARFVGPAGEPWLDLVVADDGMGIAAARRAALGLSVGALVPERYFVMDVLHGIVETMPWRTPGGKRRSGRGLIGVLQALLEAAPARVVVRTGGVLVTVDRAGLGLSLVGCASAGLGTVFQVAVPLFRGPGGVDERRPWRADTRRAG